MLTKNVLLSPWPPQPVQVHHFVTVIECKFFVTKITCKIQYDGTPGDNWGSQILQDSKLQQQILYLGFICLLWWFYFLARVMCHLLILNAVFTGQRKLAFFFFPVVVVSAENQRLSMSYKIANPIHQVQQKYSDWYNWKEEKYPSFHCFSEHLPGTSFSVLFSLTVSVLVPKFFRNSL